MTNAMKRYQGIHVPLITPFSDGKIDWEAFGKLIDWYKGTGVASIIPCGTTGESCTLNHEEHREIIRFSIERAGPALNVIAGTGSNSTYEAIALTAFAAEVGAKAALVVSPYYNRPTQEGIFEYFADIARAVPGFDLLIYNIPCRTGSNVEVDTVKRLAEIPEIKGIKEGAGDIQSIIDLAHHFLDTDFSVLTGEDTLLFNLCTVGGDGGIMAAAGVCPNELVSVFKLIQAGQLNEARALDRRLRPLIQALFCVTNPVAVKYAVAQRLGIPYELRRPLLPISAREREIVEYELTHAGFGRKS